MPREETQMFGGWKRPFCVGGFSKGTFSSGTFLLLLPLSLPWRTVLEKAMLPTVEMIEVCLLGFCFSAEIDDAACCNFESFGDPSCDIVALLLFGAVFCCSSSAMVLS